MATRKKKARSKKNVAQKKAPRKKIAAKKSARKKSARGSAARSTRDTRDSIRAELVAAFNGTRGKPASNAALNYAHNRYVGKVDTHVKKGTWGGVRQVTQNCARTAGQIARRKAGNRPTVRVSDMAYACKELERRADRLTAMASQLGMKTFGGIC